MSRYTPNLNRDGIQWSETGTWKQGQDIVDLRTFAERLIIPPDHHNGDILNSIPTPWSRLLLFESALFNNQHPSHREILDQWRGLLGVLALARPLEIDLRPASPDMTISLEDYRENSVIAKTFLDLRPSYLINNEDVETDKWNNFHFISADGQILGATSPRTLVFTGISHQCPPTIPFRNNAGRLSDPFRYYRRYNDQKYLTLLKQWLDGFIRSVANNQIIIRELGTIPSPPNVAPERRHDKLLGLLRVWQGEVNAALTNQVQIAQLGQFQPHFTLPFYNQLLFLPAINYDAHSDLLLNTEKAIGRNVVVCYRPDRSQSPKLNSLLYNERDDLIQDDSLKIYNGRWIKADERLPEKINFLPADWELIANPVAELFEDKLIEVALAVGDRPADAVYPLKLNAKYFLFPFKEKILKYYEPKEIYQYTRIEVLPDRGYRITLEIPLRGGRKIKATRIYEESANELAILTDGARQHLTSELVMWPNFKSADWNYYYYFKRWIGTDIRQDVDFIPFNGNAPRSSPDNFSHWYFSDQPIKAFIGKLGENKGLLLPRYEELPPRAGQDYWKVSVDFGSTHTRAFFLPMERLNDGSYRKLTETIEPLTFTVYARQLTICNREQLKDDFFALEGQLEPSTRAELKTQLMKPVEANAPINEWSPREGFGYMHWIHAGFDSRKLKSDIKWEGGGGRGDLRSYLRWLMIRIQAEAVLRNARVIQVLRSYPTAFSQTLKAHHSAEWVALSNFTGLAIEMDDNNLLSEAVATARYLTTEEGASSVVNTISFDIGGSTTDIAVWYGERVVGNAGAQIRPKLGAQESVKMAAGIVGRYLQTDQRRMEFLEWFTTVVRDQGKLANISLREFSNQANGYALMFYNTLSYYEQGNDELKQSLAALTGLIKAEKRAFGLLAHIIYLFGALVYYSGLLARKVGLKDANTPTYYLYFCGKGGSLIRWINNHETFVKKLFTAGLYGPSANDSSQQQNRINVIARISKKPKEEVGRGLLAETAFRVDREDDTFGLFDLKAASVTVGETGYKIRNEESNRELDWNGELNQSVLRQLESQIPAFREMKELNCFIQAISEAFEVQDPDDPVFDFNQIIEDADNQQTFVDSLLNRLFGQDENSILNHLQREGDTGALVEPILITEMKILLEFLSGNDKLFR